MTAHREESARRPKRPSEGASNSGIPGDENAHQLAGLETANDRFKRSFGSWFWGSMVAATIVHVAVLASWPNLRASDFSFTMDDIEAIDLPPEIEIPPPPEQIQRPANPVVTDAQIDEDITIAPTTFDENLPEDLPPPRSDTGADLSSGFTFVPHDVRPSVRNRSDVERALEREYPAFLKNAGMGGEVTMQFFIDEEGEVVTFQIGESSGREALDEAAMRVAHVFRFNPAYNRDVPVAVWIQIPITFRTR